MFRSQENEAETVTRQPVLKTINPKVWGQRLPAIVNIKSPSLGACAKRTAKIPDSIFRFNQMT